MKYCKELGILCVLFALSGIAESLSLGDFFGHGPQESAYYGPHGPPPPPRPYRGHPVKYVSYGKPSYGPRPTTVIRYVSKRPSSSPHLSPYSVVSESLSGGGWGGPPPPSYSSGGKPSSRPRGRPAPRPMPMTHSMDEEEYSSQAPGEDVSGMMDITNMDLTSEGPMMMTQGPDSEAEVFSEDTSSQSAPFEESGGEGETSSPAPEEPMIMMMQAPRRPSSSSSSSSASGKKPSSRGKKPSSKPSQTYYGWDDDEGFSHGGPEYFSEDVYSYDGPAGWGWGPPPSGGSSSGGNSRPPSGSGGAGGVTDTSEGGLGGTGVSDGQEEEEEVVVRTTARPRPAAPRRPTSSGRAASRPAAQRPAATPARPAAGRGASSGSSSASRPSGSSGGSAQLQDARPQVSPTSGRSAGGAGGNNAQQQSANGGASGRANMPLTSQFRDAGESSGAPEGAYGVPGRQAGQPLSGSEVSSNTGSTGRLQVQKSISSDQEELSNLSGQLDADLLRIVQQIISETKV